MINEFLDMSPKTQITKKIIDKLNLVKIKNLCTSKRVIKRVKETTSKMGENICKSCLPKSPIHRVYKGLFAKSPQQKDKPI